jgi:hypothetical protein
MPRSDSVAFPQAKKSPPGGGDFNAFEALRLTIYEF